jgi:NTP pyrophosphatase (non-canonical NTP hydrolase)
MQPDPEILARWRKAVVGREAEVDRAAKSMRHAVMLMADLHSANGCPWDREQSLASLRQYVREEADEVCRAIDNILKFEAVLRAAGGLSAADPAPPEAEDLARTTTKGLTIAHHPHREDFDPASSASGAPLPVNISGADEEQLDRLYSELAKELGDLLLQPVFQADILQAMGRMTLADCIDMLVTKLIRRHPHVYGETEVRDSAEVLANWDQIKQRERRDDGTSGAER